MLTRFHRGVSEIVGEVLLVALVVMVAGLLYVWILSGSQPHPSQSLVVSVIKAGNEDGYESLDITVVGGVIMIRDMTVRVLRNGSNIHPGDFSQAVVSYGQSHTEYGVDIDSDNTYEYIVYDNNNNTLLDDGDRLLIGVDLLSPGDVIQLDVGGKIIFLTEC